MQKLLLIVVCAVFFIVNSSEAKYDNLTHFFDSKELKSRLPELRREQLELDSKPQILQQFNCPPISRNHPEPTDATKLRFSDIKVMMALGDSITAGFAMVRKRIRKFLILNFKKRMTKVV